MANRKGIIDAEAIEKSENLLRRTYKLQTGDPRLIADRARVDRTALDTLIKAHSDLLFNQYIPDIDPRVESSIRTMFMHFFCAGAIAQRMSEGRDY